MKHNLEQISLSSSYRDTISLCKTNKNYMFLCESDGYWKRKAMHNYEFDLDRITIWNQNNRGKYKWLEQSFMTPINTDEIETSLEYFFDDNRFFLPVFNNLYYWTRRLELDNVKNTEEKLIEEQMKFSPNLRAFIYSYVIIMLQVK
jgi:hypothetical protein